ncbi:hypothetical protein [Collimonas arenae]|uniref:hypothetical protein n=1 Tax=Collimonas arenae TaxID=279058 RepID=UPI0007781A16|nr:hypothetical protein [Collimonas arenae]
MLPVCAIAVVLSYEGMKIWMGESFAINSYRIVEIIAVGIFVNSVAQLPFAWVQGTGRSHLTARLHFAELPMYMVGLYFAAINWAFLVPHGCGLYAYLWIVLFFYGWGHRRYGAKFSPLFVWAGYFCLPLVLDGCGSVYIREGNIRNPVDTDFLLYFLVYISSSK